MQERFTGDRMADLKLRGILLLIIAVAAVTAIIAGLLQLIVDPDIGSLGDALWWAVATVTTTGYGDVVPTNSAGRVVGVVLMLVGISLIPTITSLVVTVFVAQRQRATEETDRLHREEVLRRLDELGAQLTAFEQRQG
jgi:voltage-gated potassium channel